MNTREITTYVVSETAKTAEKQILVTADRNLVDKIITAWVEESAEEELTAAPLNQAK